MQLPASHGDAPLTTEGPVSACGCLPANRQHRAGRKDHAVSSVLRDGMGPEGLFPGRSRVSVLACSGSGDCGGTVRVCHTPRHDEHTHCRCRCRPWKLRTRVAGDPTPTRHVSSLLPELAALLTQPFAPRGPRRTAVVMAAGGRARGPGTAEREGAEAPASPGGGRREPEAATRLPGPSGDCAGRKLYTVTSVPRARVCRAAA